MPFDSRPITPETRVGELLEAHPELEETLLELSPAFAKLKNPVLRRTVARVTTLRHAAKIAGISLGEMIRRLRSAAGQEVDLEITESPDEENRQAPAWFQEDRIVRSLDVRPLLARGEQPIGRVMSDLKRLQPGGIYEVVAEFLPAPLIDLAQQKGFESWSLQEPPGLFRIYFCAPDSGPADSELVELD